MDESQDNSDLPTAVSCTMCDKMFTKRFSLKRHLSNVHRVEQKMSRKTMHCPIKTCESYFSYSEPLRKHLEDDHNLLLQEVTLKFATLADFFKWKKEEESERLVKYVKACGVQRLLGGVEVYRYNCHRTGTYVPEGKGLRKLKSQGSCKIGGCCPSTIKAECFPDNRVVCTYCATHVGHDNFTTVDGELADGTFDSDGQKIKMINGSENELCTVNEEMVTFKYIGGDDSTSASEFTAKASKLTTVFLTNESLFSRYGISEPDRVMLSGFVADNKPLEELFQAIYRTANKSVVKQLQVLLKHLTSININACLQNSEMATNMKEFSAELEANDEENPITLHQHSVANKDGVGVTEKFNLTVINDWQSLLLQKMGEQGVVGVDTLRGKNSQNYDVIAISVLVDLNWMVCGLCLCDKINSENLMMFFERISQRAGVISPSILLCEGTQLMKTTWAKYMGEYEKQLDCSWQVDEDVREKLIGEYYESSIRSACIYRLIREMIQTSDKMRFDEIYGILFQNVHDSAPTYQFIKYFKHYYLFKSESWADYIRAEELRTAGYALEALYQLIRKVCHNSDRSLGQALFALSQVFRWGSLDILRGEETKSELAKSVAKEHSVSLSLRLPSVIPWISGTSWTVKTKNSEHTVERFCSEVNECATFACDFCCESCKVCIHTFTCTCIGNVIQWKLCKHIHLVGRYISANTNLPGSDLIGVVATDETTSDVISVVYVPDETQQQAPQMDVTVHNDATASSTNAVDEEHQFEMKNLISEIIVYSEQIHLNARTIVDRDRLIQLRDSTKELLTLSELLGAKKLLIAADSEEDDADSKEVETYAANDHDYI